jgi:peroxiredoxin
MSTNPTCGVKQEIGARMEGFSLASIHGEEFSLEQIVYDQKGAVIIFWSSTCSHCMRYDSYLNGFRQKYPELGMAAIASREKETLAQLRAAAAARKLKFPILYDPGALVAKKWFAQQTPRAFLIDKEHLLRYRGAIDNYRYPQDPDYVAYLQPAIAEFVAGRPVLRTESASFGCAIQSIYYKLPRAL